MIARAFSIQPVCVRDSGEEICVKHGFLNRETQPTASENEVRTFDATAPRAPTSRPFISLMSACCVISNYSGVSYPVINSQMLTLVGRLRQTKASCSSPPAAGYRSAATALAVAPSIMEMPHDPNRLGQYTREEEEEMARYLDKDLPPNLCIVKQQPRQVSSGRQVASARTAIQSGSLTRSETDRSRRLKVPSASKTKTAAALPSNSSPSPSSSFKRSGRREAPRYSVSGRKDRRDIRSKTELTFPILQPYYTLPKDDVSSATEEQKLPYHRPQHRNSHASSHRKQKANGSLYTLKRYLKRDTAVARGKKLHVQHFPYVVLTLTTDPVGLPPSTARGVFELGLYYKFHRVLMKRSRAMTLRLMDDHVGTLIHQHYLTFEEAGAFAREDNDRRRREGLAALHDKFINHTQASRRLRDGPQFDPYGLIPDWNHPDRPL